jgi:Ca2+/H+ antiporter, TMEM165/GDT1 family
MPCAGSSVRRSSPWPCGSWCRTSPRTTPIATVALAARYDAVVAVVAGTTLGMMLANAPAVWLGERLLRRVPIRSVHWIAAALFAVLGVIAMTTSAVAPAS